ncbi:hypothetical protein C2I36_05290 [Rhodobacteraceae bacterium WD3A24]|nr:hypothetical protein C2I36_05290 [Rhodobacteraceae bacterium WD3A24]
MQNAIYKATRGPNALPPEHMTPAERRAELCGLLAIGLVRLRYRGNAQPSADTGESSLHSPAEQSVHATPTQEEDA